MNIPTQTTDAELGISPDSDEGSSCLFCRNMILAGAAVVAAMSLRKNTLASTPLSTTNQHSKNNNGMEGRGVRIGECAAWCAEDFANRRVFNVSFNVFSEYVRS